MEDGEIHDHRADTRRPQTDTFEVIYDPSYEWPVEDSPHKLDDFESSRLVQLTASSSQSLSKSQWLLRLLVVTSSILPAKHRIAVLDNFPELQIGRDAPTDRDTPRIRLKEMEVSKLHATVYWDSKQREWNVVDMGSKHGTFVQSSTVASTSNDKIGTRLSLPKAASMPRRLCHMDTLTIGSSTFLVHIHENQPACEECSPSSGDEIPLFSRKKAPEQVAKTASERGREAPSDSGTAYVPQKARDPRAALTNLKRSLLTRHLLESSGHSVESPHSTGQYVDRSARRRALHPASRPDAPGVTLPQRPEPIDEYSSSARSIPQLPVEVVSQPPAPVPTTNIGHRLLMQQGWQPGTSLGVSEGRDEGRMGLIEPLQVSSSGDRVGLGMAPTTARGSSQNWKDAGRERRWDSVERR